MVFTLFYDSVHSIVMSVLILLLFNGIFNPMNCEKNAENRVCKGRKGLKIKCRCLTYIL